MIPTRMILALMTMMCLMVTTPGWAGRGQQVAVESVLKVESIDVRGVTGEDLVVKVELMNLSSMNLQVGSFNNGAYLCPDGVTTGVTTPSSNCEKKANISANNVTLAPLTPDTVQFNFPIAPLEEGSYVLFFQFNCSEAGKGKKAVCDRYLHSFKGFTH